MLWKKIYMLLILKIPFKTTLSQFFPPLIYIIFSLVTIIMLSFHFLLLFKFAAIGGSLCKVAYAYFYTSSCISSTSKTTLFRDPSNTRRTVVAYM
jgi:hypothetical protein